jgi:hypothetical protein
MLLNLIEGRDDLHPLRAHNSCIHEQLAQIHLALLVQMPSQQAQRVNQRESSAEAADGMSGAADT